MKKLSNFIDNSIKAEMLKSEMHGLSLFISDIRNCKSREAEIMRINKELANIRSIFGGDKVVDGYQKKKYVCKLIFIFLLGHDFDFGHIEAVNLLNSNKYNEKFIGYLFLSIVMNEKSDLMKLVLKALENDLMSSNPHYQNLALNFIANMGNEEIAETHGNCILHLVFSGEAVDSVKQSGVLCLLRLFRIKPEIIAEKDYPERIVSFLTDHHLGVVTAATSLIEALAEAGKLDGKNCVMLAASRLNRLVRSPSIDLQDYNYYFVCAPWLSIKLLRLLRHFPLPSEVTVKSRLMESIEIILNKVQEPPKTKKVEHRISKQAIMFEAINLIYHMNMASPLQIRACNTLDMCLKQKESNLRCLALETMKLLCGSDICRERIKQQLNPIIDSLNDETDICIRQNSADLLCVLCDESNIEKITSEMFIYLETSSVSTKEEIVLKISLLAERFCRDPMRYIDIILKLLNSGGEYVTEEIWYRLIQVVTNDNNVHGYAAKRAFEELQSSLCHESLITVAGYILGEYGNLIAGDHRSSPTLQLSLLHSKFQICSKNSTKAILLTSYVKFVNLFPELKGDVKRILKYNANSPDIEIQQRAVEYLKLCDIASLECLATVLDEMPIFKRDESMIEYALSRLKSGSSERRQNKCKNTILKHSFSASSSMGSNFNSELIKYDTSLGRSSSLPRKPNTCASNYETLMDVFNNTKYLSESLLSRSISASFSSSHSEALMELIWHKSGVLFENNILRVCAEGRFHQHEGCIRFQYKNKAVNPFYNFLVQCPFESVLNKWIFEPKPCSKVINPEEEIEHEIKVECIKDFSHTPSLSLSFTWAGSHQTIPLQMPLTLNKFVEPVIMDTEEFFPRWNYLVTHQEEVIKTFPAKYIIDKNLLIKKLNGFGVGVLQNIDPNPENHVCSGIFHCSSFQVGFLFRLQPHQEAYTYKLTVRATRKTVAEEVSRLLELII